MSRYIEVSNLDIPSDENDYDELVAFADKIAEMIVDAPSIDIVFCKECKYDPICSHSVQHTTHEPTSVTIGYKSVDFCSYGERRES